MSDNLGFDFNGDGKVSFEESQLTYNIERETAQKGYISSYIDSRSSTRKTSDTAAYVKSAESFVKVDETRSEKKKSFAVLVVFLIILGIAVTYIISSLASKQKAYNDVINKIQQEKYYDAICDMRELGWSDPN